MSLLYIIKFIIIPNIVKTIAPNPIIVKYLKLYKSFNKDSHIFVAINPSFI